MAIILKRQLNDEEKKTILARHGRKDWVTEREIPHGEEKSFAEATLELVDPTLCPVRGGLPGRKSSECCENYGKSTRYSSLESAI